MADMVSTLLGIWRDVFGVPVGVTDNFFDLGGDSFAALRVLARIRDELRCEISIADLLDYPTIAELTAVVQHAHQ
jgi:acyl carrier protein